MINKLCSVPDLIMFLMVSIIVLGYSFNTLWSTFLWIIIVPFILRELYIKRQIKITMERNMAIALVVFFSCVIIAGLINGDLVSVKKSIHYMRCAIPFFIGAFLLQNYKCQSGMYWGVCTSTLVLCIWGVLRWDDSPVPLMISIYSQHNSFGMELELLIPFLLSFALIEKNKMDRLFIGAIFIFAVCCLYFSGSRGAIIGLGGGVFVAAMIYLAFYPNKSLLKTKILMVLFCFFILMTSFLVVFNVTSNRQDAGGGERIMMLEASYSMWKDHKLAGVGETNWAKNYYGQYRPEGQREQGLNMPHNMPAYYLSTTGIIGFVGYCAYIMFTGLGLIRIMRKQETINFGLMSVLVIFVAFFIHGMVDGTLINDRATKAYFLLFSLALVSGDMFIDKRKTVKP